MGGLGNRAVPQRSKALSKGEDTRKGSGERDRPAKPAAIFLAKQTWPASSPRPRAWDRGHWRGQMRTGTRVGSASAEEASVAVARVSRSS